MTVIPELSAEEAAAWATSEAPFTPGGSEEYEKAAWDTRNYRISCDWSKEDADAAYHAEMSAEGYGREAEIG